MKPVFNTLLIAMLVASFGSVTGHSSAWAKTSSIASQRRIELRAFRMLPDGKGLLVESSRPLRDRGPHSLTVLRFPQPHRVVVDIPNARLSGAVTPIAVHRNGIDRIEITEISGDFYNAVRAVIYVDDADTLSRLTPSLSGNFLKLEESAVLPPPPSKTVAIKPTAMTPLPPKVAMAVTPMPSSEIAARSSRRQAKPLPPNLTPLPAIVPLKNPPMPILNQSQTNLQTASLARPVEQRTIMGTPLLPGTSVVESVQFNKNRLLIQAHAGAPLHIKNRLVLKDPSRLVLDLDNAVLASRALLGTVEGESDRMRRVRVGQFDEKTVRLVIETPTPTLFEPVFNRQESLNTLALVPSEADDARDIFPDSRPGEVESIDLKREGGGTVLRVSASTPIVHRLTKKGERVTLELLNEAARSTSIPFDDRQYPELDRMRIEGQDSDSPKSKLSLVLANRDARVLPTLSDGGKVLELLVLNEVSGPAGNNDSLVAYGGSNIGITSPVPVEDVPVFLPSGPAPFPARIVVDAGHGGKDIGANRSGVNEKDLNLSLALMVRDALTAKGFKVYMTRSTDVFLPLPQITAITNQVHPDLFISIHHNASVNTAQHGIETYYYTPQSIPLAKKVHMREINAVGERDGGVKQARFYVIHHTDVPAILCEVGYVSNPAELTTLQGMDRKMKTARSIADGVVDYLQTRVSARAGR